MKGEEMNQETGNKEMREEEEQEERKGKRRGEKTSFNERKSEVKEER